jgi:PAS domain S-box-containing protein
MIEGGKSLKEKKQELENTLDFFKGSSNNKEMVKKLDAVIESSYDGIYITDGKANTLKINKSYERITGLNRYDMLGRNMADLEKEGYISESATLMVLKNKKVTTIQQKFSTGKKVLVTSTPIFNDDGEIVMVVTNVRDVTELWNLKEQLEKNKELAEKYYSEIEEMRLQIFNTTDLVMNDKKMLELMQMSKRIAKVDTTVLLLGETGVGKEEVAKFVHKNSTRKSKQFIKINCGAIPENLIESELFGYEEGAFTGANRKGKLGLFEVADGGTLFLDEIGELSLDMQVKLLRALQDREIKRIGGVAPIKIDVRILAATNRNLEEMVKKKLFREDLYYRLNVIPLTIPPLRERRQDIIPLIQYFLSKLNEKYGWNKYFSSEAMNCLYEYDWPGNVRELKNIVERMIIMSNQDSIGYNDLPKKVISEKSNSYLTIEMENLSLKQAVAKLEGHLLEKAYEKHGNVRAAAKALGIDASTFVRKRKRCQKNMLQI